MKTTLKYLLIFSLVSLIGFNSCDDNGDNDITDDMPSDQAKTEIGNASQDIWDNFMTMMDAEAMSAFMFLMELDPEFDKTIPVFSNMVTPKNLITFATNHQKHKAVNVSYNAKELDFDWGIYEYDFTTNSFVKVGDHDLLIIYFPADQAAFDSGDNNGVFSLTDFDYEEFNFSDEYGSWDEDIPTVVKANMKIDNNEVLNLNYSGSFQLAPEGDHVIPQSLSASLTMSPFSMNMSFSGSNRDYSASVSFKQNSDLIAGADISVRLTNNLWDDEPEKISGYIQLTPLKFDGYVNVYAFENAIDEDPPNFTVMNQNFNVDLIQVDLNAKLGHIEFKSFVDDYGEYAEPVIVYNDGQWELLDDAFADLIKNIDELIGDFEDMFD